MNRIVIIGNGFDISHGLPTKYADFMDYLLLSIVEKVPLSSSTYRFNIKGKRCEKNSYFVHKIDENEKKDPWIGVVLNKKTSYYELKSNIHEKSIYFKSLFNEFDKNKYWSDLEEHYYNLLIQYKSNIELIKTLNQEFEHLKLLLKEFLINEIENEIGEQKKYSINKNNNIYQILDTNHNDLFFKNTFFISFNYTNKVLHQYIIWLNKSSTNGEKYAEPIQIHGDLINSDNPIIFGYGDDNSKEYRELQDLKEKEVLKNFKTFQYLRSKRYQQVLGLLELEDTYIQIIGHSCDIGDRTLLRSIFQHNNVKKIETTYYDNETKYFENLYNISRVFDNNELMREKLIPLEDTFKND